MKVAIGTKNPAKVQAVKGTLIREKLRIVSVKVESGVQPQPFSDEETMNGALNRAKAALQIENADLGIGLEGGVVETTVGLMLCNWGAICHKDGRQWLAGGARIPLPAYIAECIQAGEELGAVMERVSGDQEIRKKQGAMGVYTAGWVNRKELFSHIVKLLYGQYAYDWPVKH
ncbi:DUF84 family protein [bacterium LRH843]|nr:DUF84 family protein [bacterium LRH843]